MNLSQCPCCFAPLEVRDVTPCYVCGGWPTSVTGFDPADPHTEFRLPSGRTIVLCRKCKLEEFMVPSGWGYRLIPDETFPMNSMRWIQSVEEPVLGRDKFCTTCNVRLVFAEIIAEHR